MYFFNYRHFSTKLSKISIFAQPPFFSTDLVQRITSISMPQQKKNAFWLSGKPGMDNFLHFLVAGEVAAS
jgi:hypothetical protein